MAGKNRKKRQRKIVRKKVNRKQNNIMRLGYGDRLLPPLAIVKHRYSTSFTLDGDASTYIAFHRFRVNSCYDPNFDVTIGDNSSFFYTQMKEFYHRYCVLDAKWKLTFYSRSADGSGGQDNLCVGYAIKRSYNWDPVADEVLNEPSTHSRALGPPDGNRGIVKMIGSQAISTFVGVPRHQLNSDDKVRAVTGANPNKTAYLHVFASQVTETEDPLKIDVRIELEQTAIWSMVEDIDHD